MIAGQRGSDKTAGALHEGDGALFIDLKIIDIHEELNKKKRKRKEGKTKLLPARNNKLGKTPIDSDQQEKQGKHFFFSRSASIRGLSIDR